MSVRPVEFSGLISRTQDVAQIKHNQDNKGMMDQSNIQNQVHKEIKQHAEQVIKKDNADKQEFKYDAKEKGNNHYKGQQKKREKGKNNNREEVIIKARSGFDIQV